MRKIPVPLQLFCQITVQFSLIAYSFRVLAQGRLIATVLSDGLIAFLGFYLFHNMKRAERFRDQVGYTLGAMLGSAIGMWLS